MVNLTKFVPRTGPKVSCFRLFVTAGLYHNRQYFSHQWDIHTRRYAIGLHKIWPTRENKVEYSAPN